MTPEQVDQILISPYGESAKIKEENESLKSQLNAYEFFARQVIPFLIEQKMLGNTSAILHRYVKKDKSFSPHILNLILKDCGWEANYVSTSSLGNGDSTVDIPFIIPRPVKRP